jgi:hypothetical protein
MAYKSDYKDINNLHPYPAFMFNKVIMGVKAYPIFLALFLQSEVHIMNYAFFDIIFA